MPSDYYTYLGKTVTNGEVANAEDLNTINTAVDAAFEQVETDVDAILDESQFYSTTSELYSLLSEKWAQNPYGDPVETGPNKYSAMHWAIEAENAVLSAFNPLPSNVFTTTTDGNTSFYDLGFYVDALYYNMACYLDGVLQYDAFPCDENGDLVSSGVTSYVNLSSTPEPGSEVYIKAISPDGFPDVSNLGDVVKSYPSMYAMLTATHTEDLGYYVDSFYRDEGTGSGLYKYNRFTDKADADGVMIIDPDSLGTFNGTASTLEDYFATQGTGVGNGCLIRQDNKTFDPCAWGASNLGVTDAAIGLRAMCKYMEDNNGGTAEFPSGMYRLASMDLTYEWTKDGRHACNMGSHTHFVGLGDCEIWLDGATLDPIAESGYRFNSFCIKKGAAHSSVKGFKFTTNGWVLVTNFEDCHGVSVGGDFCEVSDCWFYNLPGRNHLIVGYNNPSWPDYVYFPKGTKITRNVFQNGSDVVPGNSVAIDCGFLYIDGYDSIVEENFFFNDSLPTINCSAVENHNGRNKYINNYFKNVWPAIYIGVEGGITDGLVFEGNFIETCYGGIQTIQSTHGCKVIGNYFLNNHTTADAPGAVDHQGGKNLYSTLAGVTGIADGTMDGMIVTGNTFKEDAYVESSCINLGALQNSIIAGNTFHGFSDCIVIGLASNRATESVMIYDNIASYIPTTNYSYTRGIITFLGGDTWASTADNIHCWDNVAITEANCPKVTEYVAVGLMATYTNCVVDVMRSKNILVGITGTEFDQIDYPSAGDDVSDYTPFWTQSADPQPSLGDGTLTGHYKVVGNICTVVFEFVAGATTTFGNSASGWYFGLPRNAAFGFNQRFPILLETGSVNYPAMATIGANEDGMSIGLNRQGVRLDFPAVHGQYTNIRGVFSYFIDL